jgi:hypothetical protein
MAIIFLKPIKFKPTDVKDASYDIDDIWRAEHLNFKGMTEDRGTDTSTYDLTLIHKPTSVKTDITLNVTLYDNPQMNGNRTDIRIKSINDAYYSAHTFVSNRQRNIFIILEKSVKDIEFIKGAFVLRRTPKRDVMKKFGKIFERARDNRRW